MGLIDELRKSGSRLVDSLRGIDAFDESQKKPLLFPGVGERVTDTARGFGNKAMEVLNPGQSYLEPGLKKAGINPLLAGVAGLAVDIATPGPGELARGKKALKSGEETVKALAGKAEEVKNLLVVHNLSEQKLRFADRIGGLANPSMAVIDPKLTAFEGYGDISLIGSKELIRGQKTRLADAYTARFPSVHTSLSYDDFKKLDKDLEPYYKKIGDDARKVYHDDTDMLRNIENNPAVALRFLEEKGIKPSIEGQHYYHPQIIEAGLENEYQGFLDNLYKKYNLQEKMFAGYTPSGQRRYKPVSVEEASKIMSKQKEEGFNYGLGSYRSKIAPVKTSPEAVKKEAGRLVSKDQFEQVKEAHDSELWDLKNKLEKYAKNTDSNSFIESDNQLNAIGQVLSGEKEGLRYFKSKFPDAPQELIQDVYSFRDKLKKMPTEYFETKFKRPVGIEEFSIAVVPDTLPKEARAILERKGLTLVEYKKGEKANVMKDLLKRPEAFGIGVGLGTQSQEDK